MSSLPSECLRCRSRMEQGFMFDFMGESGRNVARWMPGAPTKSFWLGVKADTDRMLPTAAFRCVSCGLLEMYAAVQFEPK